MKVFLALVGAAIGFLAFRPRATLAEITPEVAQALEYRGLITRVARQLKLDRTGNPARFCRRSSMKSSA
jgi:hypothetical protein